MTLRAVLTLVWLCALLGLPGPANAEPDRALGERYFRAGAKAYAAQNFGAAAQNFEEAFRELPLPEVAFSAAQAYRKLYRTDPQLQHVRRAVELYKLYLDKIKIGGRVGDASDNLAEMERELERLEARGIKTRVQPAATVERTRLGVNLTVADQTREVSAVREVGDGGISANALDGLELTLDGKRLEPFALVDVAPGEHTLKVAATGYHTIEKRHRAVPGASALIDLELVAKPATVAIRTEPRATVIVDGRPAASPLLELAAGKHVVVVARAGRKPWGREITVARGERLSIDAPLAKTAKRRAAPWLALGAGTLAALAAGGAITALVADSNARDHRALIASGNAPPEIAADFAGEVARRNDARMGAFVLGGSALVVGALAVAFYAFDRPSSEGLQIVPSATPTGAGVVATQKF